MATNLPIVTLAIPRNLALKIHDMIEPYVAHERHRSPAQTEMEHLERTLQLKHTLEVLKQISER